MAKFGVLIAVLAIGFTPTLASACKAVGDDAPRGLVSNLALAPQVLSCDTADRSCRWSFALGDPVSRSVFDALIEYMRACPTFAKAVRDTGVNHPDFYDAWSIQTEDQGFTISIKDKSALQQTYVVLRVMSEMRLN